MKRKNILNTLFVKKSQKELEELKERDISKKSIEEKVAYAFEIKSLHELKAYFRNMQTGRFKNTNEPLSLHKKIKKKSKLRQ